MLPGQATLTPQRQATGMPYNQWWPALQRLPRAGLGGLLAPRPLPHSRGTASRAERLPLHGQPQIVRLALAPPCTARALARMVQTGSALPIDPRGIRRGLALPQLSPAVGRLHDPTTPQAARPPCSAGPQRARALQPSTRAQCGLQAWGPDPLRRRCRPDRAEPTDAHARWRMRALCEVGVRPRRVATL